MGQRAVKRKKKPAAKRLPGHKSVGSSKIKRVVANISKQRKFVYIASFIVVGGIIYLLAAHAATIASSFEAERASLTGNASVISDASASASNAVVFGGSMRCGLVSPAFCDTFDHPAGIGNRSGDLNGTVWGVSRNIGSTNFGQNQLDEMPPTTIRKCDGSTPRVLPPQDVIICNGQLREATNDNVTGQFDFGDVTVKAMYPKQPFDWAGRTGKVTFDVSNDTHGNHGAWPEFWVSDKPVPTPFNHFDSWQSLPKDGFGIRMEGNAAAGQFGGCPNADNINQRRWTVGEAVVVRNYKMEDVNGDGGGFNVGNMRVEHTGCVTMPPDDSGIMNHVEIRVNQNQIEVWATDAGTTGPLKQITVVHNANLTLTRGLIWLEDVHYNADKAGEFGPSQREHTFVWDNVGFDGPFTYRDLSYDALDNRSPGRNGAINLGKYSPGNGTVSWDVLNLPANRQASAVRVMFNFFQEVHPNPTVLTVTVNGHPHPTPWPYPDDLHTLRTIAVDIPISDLVTGTNVVQLGSDQPLMTSNVNIVLVDVP